MSPSPLHGTFMPRPVYMAQNPISAALKYPRDSQSCSQSWELEVTEESLWNILREPTHRNGTNSALDPHHLQTWTPWLPVAQFWPLRTPADLCVSQCAISGAATRFMATGLCHVHLEPPPSRVAHTHLSGVSSSSEPAWPHLPQRKAPQFWPGPPPHPSHHTCQLPASVWVRRDQAPQETLPSVILDLLPTPAIHCFLAQGKRTVSEFPPRPKNSKIFVIYVKKFTCLLREKY